MFTYITVEETERGNEYGGRNAQYDGLHQLLLGGATVKVEGVKTDRLRHALAIRFKKTRGVHISDRKTHHIAWYTL